MRHQTTRRLRHWLTDTQGSVSVEAMLMLPLLAWVYLAMFVYFDAYKAKNTNLKAAYSIADALSREANVTGAYLNTMDQLLNFLTSSNHPTKLRISVVRYDTRNEDFYIRWSQVRGTGINPWNSATIDDLSGRLPRVPDLDSIILVETFSAYEPAFNVGIDAFSIDNLVVSRPRYYPGLCFDSGSAC
ncbi:MAG: hypothetical protein ACI853_000948 [Paracoccaceae bacterium]|jgi:hypothetical protein